MRIFYSLLILLFICSPSYAKRLDEMNANTSPDITNDLIYSQDVSDTSENSHGTGKSLTIKNLLKATKINVDGTNVGINTITPTQQLEVVGTVKATSFMGDGSGLTGVSGSVSDSAYGVGWDGDTTTGASKNALYDKIETLGSASISNAVYGAGWDGDTSTAPSKNAIYDKIETIGSTSGGWTDGGSSIYTTTSTDNVGIGTPNPQFLLDVNGSSRVGGSGNIAFDNSVILNASVDNILGITGGNVGINSTTPESTLDVLGTGRFTSTLRASSLTATGLTSGQCVQTTTGGLLTTTGSACGSGGSVTIGTTSPMTGAGSGSSFTLGVDQSKMTLSSIGGTVTDAQVPNSITIDTATTASALATNPTACGSGEFVTDIAADGTLFCDTPSGGGGGVGIGTINPGTVGALTKYVSSTVIDDSPLLFEGGSNIGIGTTGPVQKLEVVGTVKATTFSGAGTGLTGTAASLTAGNVTTNANLTGGVTSVGNVATVVTNANLTGEVTSSGNAATIADSVTVTGWALGASTASTPAEDDNDTSLATTAYVQTEISGLGSGGWTDNGTVVYNTTTTDNVGIGTTSNIASTKFQVSGNSGTTDDDFIGLFVQNGVTPESSGLSNAGRAVGVQGSGGAYFVGRDVTNDIEFIMGTSTAGASFVGSYTAHDLQFRTNNSTQMILKNSSGNVGIGTTVPVGLLNVSGGYVRIGNGGTNTNATSSGEAYVQGDLEVDGTIYGSLSGNASTVTTNANLTGDVTSSGNATTLSSTYKGWTDGGTNIYPTLTSDQVAIGTTTPISGASLTVLGTLAGAGTGPIAFTNANVGIGTTTAGALLTVGSTGQATIDSSGIIQPAGYKSADGTTGATVTTCTGFKNGLCISGT